MKPVAKIILASVLLLILLSAAIARADDGGGSGSGDHGGHDANLILKSGNLTVIFNGEKPNLRIIFRDDARQVFDIRFTKLLEFNATNGGLAFQANETVQKASLEAANWTTTGFFNITDGVAINFTTHQLLIEPASEVAGHQVALMDDGGGSHDGNNGGHLANVDVTFEAKLFKTSTTKTFVVGNSTFTVQGGVEIKVDVLIAHWPFLSLRDRLALRIDLQSNVNEFKVHEDDGEHEINANNNHTDHHEHEIHEDENEGTIQVLTQSGLVGGFFRFVNTALTDGKPTPVAASFRAEQDEVQQTENEFKLFLSYHSFSQTLEHDPSFGINPAALRAASAFTALTPLAVAVLTTTFAGILIFAKKRRTL